MFQKHITTKYIYAEAKLNIIYKDSVLQILVIT